MQLLDVFAGSPVYVAYNVAGIIANRRNCHILCGLCMKRIRTVIIIIFIIKHYVRCSVSVGSSSFVL